MMSEMKEDDRVMEVREGSTVGHGGWEGGSSASWSMFDLWVRMLPAISISLRLVFNSVCFHLIPRKHVVSNFKMIQLYVDPSGINTVFALTRCFLWAVSFNNKSKTP